MTAPAKQTTDPIPAFLANRPASNETVADAIEVQRDNVRPMRGSTAAEAEAPKPRGKKAPPSKSDLYVAGVQSDKDQTMTRIQALQAQKAAAEEEAVEAIRRIEAERDGKIAGFDADLAEENVILAGHTGAIEAAAAAVRRAAE